MSSIKGHNIIIRSIIPLIFMSTLTNDKEIKSGMDLRDISRVILAPKIISRVMLL